MSIKSCCRGVAEPSRLRCEELDRYWLAGRPHVSCSVMAWSQRYLPPDTAEIGALAHGPRILARAPGILVGLRSIVAYSSGLDLAVVAVAAGPQADAMRSQFTAPAEIDAETGQPYRGELRREMMQLRALEDSRLQPVLYRSTEGFHQKPNSYRREYLYEISDLPHTTELPLVAAWPEIGLDPVTTYLEIPTAEVLQAAIISLL